MAVIIHVMEKLYFDLCLNDVIKMLFAVETMSTADYSCLENH